MDCFITRRGGGSPQGFFPSLFVTGLQQTDTCTATCNGKSFVGEWTTKTVKGEEKALIPTMTSATTPSGVVTSSSSYSDNYAPYKAFDGNLSGYGFVGKNTDTLGSLYLQYEFPKKEHITRVSAYEKLGDTRSCTWKIQGSNNGTSFTDLGTILVSSSNTMYEEEITTNESYKYYRFVFMTVSKGGITSGDGWHFQLYETGETSTSGFSFPRLTELGTYSVSDGSSTMDILVDAPIEYTLEWSIIPRNGLVAEYLFDGDTLDTSPNGNDLTNSRVTFSNNVGVFSGSAYAQASSKVLPENSPYSISVWFKKSGTGYDYLFDTINGSSANKGISIQFKQSGQIQARINNSNSSTEYQVASQNNVNDGIWHHLVFTWTGTTETNGIKLYIDGVLDAQATSSFNATTHTYNLTIGKPNKLTQYYLNGSLDNIRIYSRVLTDTEIEALYDEFLPINYTMLYDRGDECTDVTGGWTFVKGAALNYTSSKNTDNLYWGGSREGSGASPHADTSNSISVSGYNSILEVSEFANGYGGYNRYDIPYATSLYTLNMTSSSKATRIFPISSSANNTLSRVYGTSYSNASIKLYTICLIKPDNWEKLCTLANISTLGTLSDLLSNTTSLGAIFNNADCVSYIVSRCSGDFMVGVLSNSSAVSTLKSSTYAQRILESKHWAKFVSIMGIE